MRVTSRPLLVSISLVCVASVASTAPAYAAEGATDPSLLSRYFPTTGQTTVATDQYSSYVYQFTYWQAPSRIANLRDNDGDAYEHEVTLFTGSGCWSDKYDRNSWDSDYPSAYLDTDFDDNAENRTNRAGGTGKSSLLGTGRHYYHWLRVKGKCPDGYPYVIRAQDSHRKGSCAAGWEWCVYADTGSPRDIVPYTFGPDTGTTHNWHYGRLYNDGFEDGGAGWSVKANDSRYAAKWAVWTSSGSLDRRKYFTFRCNGGPGCYVSQNTPNVTNGVTPDDIWTGEFGARCHPKNPSDTYCPVTLGLSAMGGNADEHVSRVFSVPNDGKWHIYGYRGRQYAAHTRMRFLISNDSTDNKVDLDLMTLHRSDRFV